MQVNISFEHCLNKLRIFKTLIIVVHKIYPRFSWSDCVHFRQGSIGVAFGLASHLP